MAILFSNPPWWENKESRGFLRKKRWRRGVRAGSRWPFTYLGRCTPDNSRANDYIPYPFYHCPRFYRFSVGFILLS